MEKTDKVEDEAVLERRRQNKSDVEILKQALRSREKRVKRYEEERAFIQKAASTFAVFLKHSAIKPWNDSKLAYLNHMIREVSIPVFSIT